MKKRIFLFLILLLCLPALSCQIYKEASFKTEDELFKETTLSIEQGEIEEAKTLIEEFSDRYPGSPKLPLLNTLISKKLYQNGKNDEALSYISRVSAKKADISIN